jgi:hypothetical protein
MGLDPRVLLAGPRAAAQIERGGAQVDLSLADHADHVVPGLEVGNGSPGASTFRCFGCHAHTLAIPARAGETHCVKPGRGDDGRSARLLGFAGDRLWA